MSMFESCLSKLNPAADAHVFGMLFRQVDQKLMAGLAVPSKCILPVGLLETILEVSELSLLRVMQQPCATVAADIADQACQSGT